MALSKGTSEDAAMREDSQIQFAKSFVDFLKQHREVLPTLPEMLERLISIEASESQNFDLSREDEKRVLAKRKKADLYRHHKSLQDEITEKNERIKELKNIIQGKDAQINALKGTTSFSRIMQLEDELHKKTKELEKLCKDKEEEVTSWKNLYTTIKSSSDKYIKDAEAKEEKLQELTDRITSLESELKSKDKEMDLIKANKEEQIREYKNRFDKLKKQYEEASSRKDQDLKELNFKYSTFFKSLA